MTLRATQHYVEVAEMGDSLLRATQSYVEVAEIGDSEVLATQMYVEVLGVISGATDYPESVDDTLGITDAAVATGDRQRSASNTLTLAQDVSRFRLNVEDTIIFFDGVVDFLAVDDFKPISHTMTLVQVVYTSNQRSVDDPMTLSQTLGVVGPIVVSPPPSHVLGLQDSAHVCEAAPWSAIEVESVMELTDVVGIGRPETVTDTMTLIDEAYRNDSTDHWLAMVQYVSAGLGKNASNIMELTHAIVTENDFGRAVEHSSIVQDALAYYNNNPCATKRYNRFEGSGPAEGIGEAPLTFDANFVLETLSGDKVKLELRSPETDDKQRIGFSRVNRETRGGELNVYSDPSWPKFSSLLFTIVALSDGQGSCPDKITAVLDFLQDNLGREILLHDWEGISWRGVITTPDEVATEDRNGWWTLAFEFQGEALDGSQGDQDLAIQDAVLLNGDWGRSASSTMALEQTIGVSGILAGIVSQDLGLSDVANVEVDTSILSDDFSGGAGTDLHGQSPDVGDSTWSAHTNYKADGSQTAINSGAYYPFVPEEGTNYEIIWKPRTMTHSNGYSSWFYLGEGLNSDPDNVGSTAWGRFDPTTMKVGFGVGQISGTHYNSCQLGSEIDGWDDGVGFTDGTLKVMATNLDMRMDLDTTGGENNWTATWYAKDPADSVWTLVRAETDLISENITMVGWSNDNATTVVDMLSINVTQKVSV